MISNTEKKRRYTKKHKHPCLDCGSPVHPDALRCRRCAVIKSWQERANMPPMEQRVNHCIDCGKEISWQHTRIAKRCRECSIADNTKRFSKITGAKHPSWRGGRYESLGYVYIYKPEHPRASQGPKKSYVREHIVVWEEANGKPLPKGWMVHHLNGITNDNRPSNLQGLSSKKHYLVLQAKAKRIQELEALLNGQNQLL